MNLKEDAKTRPVTAGDADDFGPVDATMKIVQLGVHDYGTLPGDGFTNGLTGNHSVNNVSFYGIPFSWPNFFTLFSPFFHSSSTIMSYPVNLVIRLMIMSGRNSSQKRIYS